MAAPAPPAAPPAGLSVAVLGYGRLGSLLAARLAAAGHAMVAVDSTLGADPAAVTAAAAAGVRLYASTDVRLAFTAAAPDVVLLAVPILAAEACVRGLPLDALPADGERWLAGWTASGFGCGEGPGPPGSAHPRPPASHHAPPPLPLRLPVCGRPERQSLPRRPAARCPATQVRHFADPPYVWPSLRRRLLDGADAGASHRPPEPGPRQGGAAGRVASCV